MRAALRSESNLPGALVVYRLLEGSPPVDAP